MLLKFSDIFTSLSSQELNMSTNETRSMICNCVNTLLTNLPSGREITILLQLIVGVYLS